MDIRFSSKTTSSRPSTTSTRPACRHTISRIQRPSIPQKTAATLRRISSAKEGGRPCRDQGVNQDTAAPRRTLAETTYALIVLSSTTYDKFQRSTTILPFDLAHIYSYWSIFSFVCLNINFQQGSLLEQYNYYHNFLTIYNIILNYFKIMESLQQMDPRFQLAPNGKYFARINNRMVEHKEAIQPSTVENPFHELFQSEAHYLKFMSLPKDQRNIVIELRDNGYLKKFQEFVGHVMFGEGCGSMTNFFVNMMEKSILEKGYVEGKCGTVKDQQKEYIYFCPNCHEVSE
ncbi:hypothetical protein FGO68_gene16159 [Halteria grandinella]|uniref:Uncharacterized protein n=1 Tax=Halteria grandinella TaxID=5974 RepID=A0A8J8T0P2_HALGN|nr:hypothetical protein FGO68_gene16159 [Halteria grandinella]